MVTMGIDCWCIIVQLGNLLTAKAFMKDNLEGFLSSISEDCQNSIVNCLTHLPPTSPPFHNLQPKCVICPTARFSWTRIFLALTTLAGEELLCALPLPQKSNSSQEATQTRKISNNPFLSE
eukprot:c27454_g1_i2 orf=556-918(+)